MSSIPNRTPLPTWHQGLNYRLPQTGDEPEPEWLPYVEENHARIEANREDINTHNVAIRSLIDRNKESLDDRAAIRDVLGDTREKVFELRDVVTTHQHKFERMEQNGDEFRALVMGKFEDADLERKTDMRKQTEDRLNEKYKTMEIIMEVYKDNAKMERRLRDVEALSKNQEEGLMELNWASAFAEMKLGGTEDRFTELEKKVEETDEFRKEVEEMITRLEKRAAETDELKKENKDLQEQVNSLMKIIIQERASANERMGRLEQQHASQHNENVYLELRLKGMEDDIKELKGQQKDQKPSVL